MERFGRYAMVVVLLASAAILIFVGPCVSVNTTGSTSQQPGNTTTPQAAARVFTRAELAKNNGQNGNPAYVAVDGYVYDVTGAPHFVGGLHSVCDEDSKAGQDLSDEMSEAPPNMRQMLQAYPIVGSMAGAHVAAVPTTTAQVPQKTFTVAELAKYTGQNGQPAYVGADGLVYDVSKSPFWGGGKHSMCNINSIAGKDLTQALNQSPPNMRTLLKKFPVVGRLQ